MHPYIATGIGRVIMTLITTVSLIDNAAAGRAMPIEIRAFHQNGTVNIYKSHSDISQTNGTRAASIALLQNRPPDDALLSAFGLPRPLNEYTHIAVSSSASDGKGGDVPAKIIYRADKQNNWRRTTIDEISKTNSAPSWWLDDKFLATWRGSANKTKTQDVIWTGTSDGQTKTHWYSPTNTSQSRDGWVTFESKNLDSDSANKSVPTPHTVFVEGPPLPQNIKAMPWVSKSLVAQKSASLKFPKAEEIKAIRAIATRPLEKGTLVLNALPAKTSMTNLAAIGIPPSQFLSWIGVSEKFNKLDLPAYHHIRSPSKAQIQKVLMQDSIDTIILVAHNSDGRIYLSGSDGDITLDEISLLKRDKALARAIVLITCKAGAVNGSTKSLAEIIKTNKLATVVYASPDDVDASLAPDILNELHTNTTWYREGIDDVMKKYNYTLIAAIYKALSIGG